MHHHGLGELPRKLLPLASGFAPLAFQVGRGRDTIKSFIVALNRFQQAASQALSFVWVRHTGGLLPDSLLSLVTTAGRRKLDASQQHDLYCGAPLALKEKGHPAQE